MMMMMVVIIMTITSVFVSHLYSEKLGYFSSNPGDSCKHIRDVEDSSGDGEYWIDPEKNGNPLKVFCDMTTDGGTSCKKHVRKTHAHNQAVSAVDSCFGLAAVRHSVRALDC